MQLPRTNVGRAKLISALAALVVAVTGFFALFVGEDSGAGGQSASVGAGPVIQQAGTGNEAVIGYDPEQLGALFMSLRARPDADGDERNRELCLFSVSELALNDPILFRYLSPAGRTDFCRKVLRTPGDLAVENVLRREPDLIVDVCIDALQRRIDLGDVPPDVDAAVKKLRGDREGIARGVRIACTQRFWGERALKD